MRALMQRYGKSLSGSLFNHQVAGLDLASFKKLLGEDIEIQNDDHKLLKNLNSPYGMHQLSAPQREEMNPAMERREYVIKNYFATNFNSVRHAFLAFQRGANKVNGKLQIKDIVAYVAQIEH